MDCNAREVQALYERVKSDLSRADERNKHELQMADQFLASMQASLSSLCLQLLSFLNTSETLRHSVAYDAVLKIFWRSLVWQFVSPSLQ
jgi:hypothetical protein